MHLLVCSFFIDFEGEGICTGRLLRALLDQGCEITLISSCPSGNSWNRKGLKYVHVPRPEVPAYLNSAFTRLTRTTGCYFFWCRKVARLAAKLTRPDLVYGRSSPISSAEAARQLARRLRAPLWTHMGDPFPSPWVKPGSAGFRRLASFARRIAMDSDKMTFLCEEMLNFQARSVRLDLQSKSFIVPHIIPAPACLASPPGDDPVFAYIGTLYGKRNGGALLEGFARHLRASPQSRLRFVGTNPAVILPAAEKLGITKAVDVVPRVPDVRPEMARASVLVAMDVDCGEPVFISTKIMEYLVVDRPVLQISPERSPGAKLARRFPGSAQIVTTETPEAIAEGMAQVLRMRPTRDDYTTRFETMQEYSPAIVARQFLHAAGEFLPGRAMVQKHDPELTDHVARPSHNFR